MSVSGNYLYTRSCATYTKRGNYSRVSSIQRNRVFESDIYFAQNFKLCVATTQDQRLIETTRYYFIREPTTLSVHVRTFCSSSSVSHSHFLLGGRVTFNANPNLLQTFLSQYLLRNVPVFKVFEESLQVCTRHTYKGNIEIIVLNTQTLRATAHQTGKILLS